MGGRDGVDATLKKYRVDALILPTRGMQFRRSITVSLPWDFDTTFCYMRLGHSSSRYSRLSTRHWYARTFVSCACQLTLVFSVPLGFTPDNVIPGPAEPVIGEAPGMPFGLTFMGTAWSEFELIKYAYAYEQATHVRLGRRAFEIAVPKTQLIDVMV